MKGERLRCVRRQVLHVQRTVDGETEKGREDSNSNSKSHSAGYNGRLFIINGMYIMKQ